MKRTKVISIFVAFGLAVAGHSSLFAQPTMNGKPMKRLPDGSYDGRPEPTNESERLAREGDDAQRAKDYPRAERLLEEAIKAADKDHNDKSVREPLYQLSGLYFRDGKYDKAEPLMLRMVKMRDKDLAQISPAFKSAVAEMSRPGGRLFALNWPFPPYPTNLVDIYEKTGRSREAEDYLKHVLDAERGVLPSWFAGEDLVQLADYYMAHDHWQRAAPLLEERYRLVQFWDGGFNGTDFDSVHKLVTCLRKTNSSSRAIERLELPIKGLSASARFSHDRLNSWNPLDRISIANPKMFEDVLVVLYPDKGDCLRDIKNFGGAREAYKAALAIDPKCKAALDGLAAVPK